MNLIDYSKYEVDLQLFSYGGELESMVPEQVRLLPPLPYYDSLSEPLSTYPIHNPVKYTKARIEYSSKIRKNELTNPEKAVVFWQLSHDCFEPSDKEYDAAIAYAQGTPTFYVADCAKASRKYAWVNAVYSISEGYNDYVTQKYDGVDRIVFVSAVAKNEFYRSFRTGKKPMIIRDIMNPGVIFKMADLKSDAEEEMKYSGVKILTVGRLSNHKGYDIALDACETLKNRGLSFRWYILGKGYLEEEIQKSIVEKQLEDYICLLGTRTNPYPYFKQADIYVQTSRFEGFGIAIAEARILNVPVVTTSFDAVYTQMVNGENGLVVDMNAAAVADGIERLTKDRDLYEHIKEYLSKEKKGNTEELLKFYELIES
ncbi:MAG: glycosyltransferase [Solobacterium sp.]|nr:glycosyltransferase [Solobacterium sp.]